MQERHPDFNSENEWLAYILEYLEEYRKRISSKKVLVDAELYESLKKYDPDNLEQYNEVTLNTELQASLNIKTRLSKTAVKKPYFARVDFKANDEERKKEYYIGKMPLIRDEDNAPLIIDWRAPVSTLYYEGRIGTAEYECPDGIITGEISLKRQYIIENAELREFFDIDITANDEFLQIALGSSKDNRLKDIVSTIQSEQNRIIRADMLKPVVVQGAAGSGKTTIALHRIAYLLYNYENRISPHNIVIIAPNRYFLSYISEVLPDLGVENVMQTTMEDFACSYINSDIKIMPSSDKLAFLVNNPHHFNTVARVSKIKTSLVFKKIIDAYIDRVTMELIPDRDFTLASHILFSHDKLRGLLLTEYSYLPVCKRINEIKKYLTNTLKTRKPIIIDEINKNYDEKLYLIKQNNPEDSEERRAEIRTLLGERDEALKQIKRQAETIIRDYFKKTDFHRAEDYYRELMLDTELLSALSERYLQREDITRLYSLSAQAIQSGGFEAEDIAPIMYIHNIIYGGGGTDIRHIVIDEAQDVGLFQYLVLRKIMGSDSFSIFGDVCQGIYSFRGVNDWSDVTGKIFNHYARFMTLEQSYRTTVEIMEFANKISRHINLPAGTPLARPVIRHGNAVTVKILDSSGQISAEISKKITEYKTIGYKSIAVICKTMEEVHNLRTIIDYPDIRMINGIDNDYVGGIVILPCHLAKGLEFDGVIIADAGSEKYGTGDLDMKLLYIAMTRALHELTIYAKWDLCEALR